MKKLILTFLIYCGSIVVGAPLLGSLKGQESLYLGHTVLNYIDQYSGKNRIEYSRLKLSLDSGRPITDVMGFFESRAKLSIDDARLLVVFHEYNLRTYINANVDKKIFKKQFLALHDLAIYVSFEDAKTDQSLLPPYVTHVSLSRKFDKEARGYVGAVIIMYHHYDPKDDKLRVLTETYPEAVAILKQQGKIPADFDPKKEGFVLEGFKSTLPTTNK